MYLGWAAEEQSARVKVVGASLGPVAAVHVLRFGRGPLPVVQRLLRAGHHLTEEGSEGAGPLHTQVREEGHGLGQATGIHAGDEIVQSLGEEHHGRLVDVAGPGAAVALWRRLRR